MQSSYSRLTTQQWEIIEKILPVKQKGKYKLCDIVDAILWQLRVGAQWRNLPECFPKWNSVYYFFRKWTKNGTLVGLNAALNKMERLRQQREPTPSLLSIDSQSIKAAPFTHQSKGVDGNKKVNGRKRHVITDSLRLIWGVVVSGANEADGVVASKVVEPLLGYLHRMEKILADHAYKATFMNWVEQHVMGLEVEISSAPPTIKGFVPLKWRGRSISSEGSTRTMKRLLKVKNRGYYGKIVKSS